MVEWKKLPDHGLPLPFYHNWSSNPLGNLSGGVYRPRTDGGAHQPRPPPEPSTANQQEASASASAPNLASASATATTGRASGMPSFSSDFRHPSAEHVGHAPVYNSTHLRAKLIPKPR
jgi:hypothetical protein